MLTKFGSKKTAQALGIDISSTTIKVLGLSRIGDRYRVESYAVVPLPSGAIVEKNIQQVEIVGALVRELVEQSGVEGCKTVTAVSTPAAITKQITMPAGLSESDLELQVMLEADRHIPYSLDEVALDFEVTGPVPGRDDQIEVLLAACRQETIQPLVEVMEIANLQPHAVDVEYFAIERAVSLMSEQFPQKSPQTIAVVDVGAAVTTLSVFSERQPIYAREQQFGGKQLTDEIMVRYGVPYEEAGRLKKHGGLPEHYEEEVLAPFRNAVVQQVERALQFYSASNEQAELDRLILCGGVASLDGLPELMQERLLAETVVANPFSAMSVAASVNKENLIADAPALLVASGLAMRGVG